MQCGQPGIAQDRAPHPLALGRVADDQVALHDVPAPAGQLLHQFVSHFLGRPGGEPVVEPRADELPEDAAALRAPLVESDEDAADEVAGVAADIGRLLGNRQTAERAASLVEEDEDLLWCVLLSDSVGDLLQDKRRRPAVVLAGTAFAVVANYMTAAGSGSSPTSACPRLPRSPSRRSISRSSS